MKKQKNETRKVLESLIREQLKIVIKSLLLGEEELEEASTVAGGSVAGAPSSKNENNSLIRE